jgi:hypothetical protein
VRLILVAAVLAISCTSSRDDLGGYLNGVCVPTTRRDAQAVATTTGQFGLIGSTSLTGDDVARVVWRSGGPITSLAVIAYRLDPPSAGTSVRWTAAGYGTTSPWGEVGYSIGMKPIGTPGCWRVQPEGGRTDDGVVIAIRPL